MIDPKTLLTALQKRVLLLEDDLRARCHAQPEVDAPLRKDYEAAREKGRTGLTYNAWRDEELTQITADAATAVMEVHLIKTLSQAVADERNNMIVLTPTLHALVHLDPRTVIDLTKGVLELPRFGLRAKLNVKPNHSG